MFLIEVMGSVLVIDLLEIESDCKNIKLYVKINYQQQKNIVLSDEAREWRRDEKEKVSDIFRCHICISNS